MHVTINIVVFVIIINIFNSINNQMDGINIIDTVGHIVVGHVIVVDDNDNDDDDDDDDVGSC